MHPYSEENTDGTEIYEMGPSDLKWVAELLGVDFADLEAGLTSRSIKVQDETVVSSCAKEKLLFNIYI